LPTAQDNCDGPVAVTATRSDGMELNDPYEPGTTTTVTFTSEDACGNSSECEITVEVFAYDIMLGAVDDEPGDSVVFGGNGNIFILYLDDIEDGTIFSLLPGSGQPRPLEGVTTYSGSIDNTLLAQTITFFFNMWHNPAIAYLELETNTIITGSSSDCGETLDPFGPQETFSIKQSVIDYLEVNYPDKTVASLFQLANDILAGDWCTKDGDKWNCDINPSDVSEALDAFNIGFNGCRMFVGFRQEEEETKSGNIATSSDLIQEDGLNLTVYPNPFSSNLRFEFSSQSDTHILLEIYDIRGVKIKTLYNDFIYGGQLYNVQFDGSAVITGSYYYRLISETEVKTGKLIKTH